MLSAMVILFCGTPLLKIAKTCSRITTCLYIIVSSYGAVAGIKYKRRLTTGIRSEKCVVVRTSYSVLTQT